MRVLHLSANPRPVRPVLYTLARTPQPNANMTRGGRAADAARRSARPPQATGAKIYTHIQTTRIQRVHSHPCERGSAGAVRAARARSGGASAAVRRAIAARTRHTSAARPSRPQRGATRVKPKGLDAKNAPKASNRHVCHHQIRTRLTTSPINNSTFIHSTI